MPTFDYACCGCWEEFEALRPIAERNAPINCPKCGTPAVREFKPCALRQPCKGWSDKTARDLLGRDQKSERVLVTKGMAKVTPR